MINNYTKLILILTSSLFFLTGCATTNNLASFNPIQQGIIKKIMNEDNAWHYNTKAIDLDKDGKKEAIIIYAFGTHQSGIKVIKFNGEKADILFDETCTTPGTEFKTINKVPTIIMEQSDYTPDYATGGRYKEIYQWDGKNFVLKNTRQ